uniref:Uncharacterized protein n=1 Tax=Setaria viridis TaxID=4556 RepID=A0A4U6UZH1_SETVI|nr:hypothetical protein SEVIR_4G075500v2 [Setaria viridis]
MLLTILSARLPLSPERLSSLPFPLTAASLLFLPFFQAHPSPPLMAAPPFSPSCAPHYDASEERRRGEVRRQHGGGGAQRRSNGRRCGELQRVTARGAVAGDGAWSSGICRPVRWESVEAWQGQRDLRGGGAAGRGEGSRRCKGASGACQEGGRSGEGAGRGSRGRRDGGDEGRDQARVTRRKGGRR